MTPVTPPIIQTDDPAPKAYKFGCAEVFGGNRAVNLPLKAPGITGQVLSIPCRSGVGGDIHYVSTCGSGIMSRFCVADVVGHGAEVGPVSAHTHLLLRRFLNTPNHRVALRTLNDRLTSRGLEALTTAAVFTYFPPTRSLTFSYAGHPPAWFYSARIGRWFRLELSEPEGGPLAPINFPLAVTDAADYTIEKIKVDPGDMLVLASDGLTDALNGTRNIFGAARVSTVLARHHNPRDIVNGLIDELSGFCGDQPFTHDDVTILAIRFDPMSRMDCLRDVLRNRVLRPIRSFARRA